MQRGVAPVNLISNAEVRFPVAKVSPLAGTKDGRATVCLQHTTCSVVGYFVPGLRLEVL